MSTPSVAEDDGGVQDDPVLEELIEEHGSAALSSLEAESGPPESSTQLPDDHDDISSSAATD